jgi:hypothetical protein
VPPRVEEPIRDSYRRTTHVRIQRPRRAVTLPGDHPPGSRRRTDDLPSGTATRPVPGRPVRSGRRPRWHGSSPPCLPRSSRRRVRFLPRRVGRGRTSRPHRRRGRPRIRHWQSVPVTGHRGGVDASPRRGPRTVHGEPSSGHSRRCPHTAVVKFGVAPTVAVGTRLARPNPNRPDLARPAVRESAIPL